MIMRLLVLLLTLVTACGGNRHASEAPPSERETTAPAVADPCAALVANTPRLTLEERGSELIVTRAEGLRSMLEPGYGLTRIQQREGSHVFIAEAGSPAEGGGYRRECGFGDACARGAFVKCSDDSYREVIRTEMVSSLEFSHTQNARAAWPVITQTSPVQGATDADPTTFIATDLVWRDGAYAPSPSRPATRED